MSKFLSREKKAVSIMVQIAEARGENVPTHAIKGISVSYIEQLLAQLKRAGLVKSQRGPSGGYQLALNAFSISVRSVCEAVTVKSDKRKDMNHTECLFALARHQTMVNLEDTTIDDVVSGSIY